MHRYIKQLTLAVAAISVAASGMSLPATAKTFDTRPSIIFASDRDGNLELYTATRKGDNLERLTHTSAIHEQSPSLSPDGAKVAYQADNAISILDLKTNTVVTPLSRSDTQYYTPAWSPDGKHIAFSMTSRTSEGPINCIGIYTVATDSSSKITCSGNVPMSPSWSPDSKTLLFRQFVFSTGGDLYKINAFDGSEKQRIATGISGAFSPAGDQIAYTARDENNVNQIFIADTNGAHPVKLTSGDDYHTVVDWGKDGYITYTNASEDGYTQVKSIKSDNSDEVTLLNVPGTYDLAGKGLLYR